MSRPDYYEYNSKKGTIEPRWFVFPIIFTIVVFIVIFAVGISIFEESESNYKANDNSAQTGTNTSSNGNSKNTSDDLPTNLEYYVHDGTYEHRGPVTDAYGTTYDTRYWDIPINVNDSYAFSYIEFSHPDIDFNYLSGTFFPNPNNGEDVTFEVFIYGSNSISIAAKMDLLYSSGMISQSSKPIDYTINVKGCRNIEFRILCHTEKTYDERPRIIFTDAEFSY